MTDREKKEFYDEFGKELMDYAFDEGFEAFFDAMQDKDICDLDALEKAFKKSRSPKQKKCAGRSEIEELEDMLNKLFGDDCEEEDDYDYDGKFPLTKSDLEVIKMSNDIFEHTGTFPEACWNTICGAVTGKPVREEVYMMAVVCEGDNIYVIDRDGNKQYEFKRGMDPVKMMAANIYSFLSDRLQGK